MFGVKNRHLLSKKPEMARADDPAVIVIHVKGAMQKSADSAAWS